MHLKSYKKFYFHCLANAELKTHTKVLKNLFHNMTLKKHIWPLYYQHILASEKALIQIIMSLMWERDWDQVQLWLLKSFFFPNVYISVNTILEYCYIFGWDIGPPLSTYATRKMAERSSKMRTGAYMWRGVEKSVLRYVRIKWMAPK